MKKILAAAFATALVLSGGVALAGDYPAVNAAQKKKTVVLQAADNHGYCPDAAGLAPVNPQAAGQAYQKQVQVLNANQYAAGTSVRVLNQGGAGKVNVQVDNGHRRTGLFGLLRFRNSGGVNVRVLNR